MEEWLACCTTVPPDDVKDEPLPPGIRWVSSGETRLLGGPGPDRTDEGDTKLTDDELGPFLRGVWIYVEAGWGVVPVTGKHPLVKGYTGYEGRWPDHSKYQYWTEEFEWASIAIRLPPGFIGFDADLYKPDPDGKRAGFLEQLALPITYRSTSRDDGSGISLYRVPEGMRFQSAPAPGIEVIQFHHRVVVCWPSPHRDRRRTYRWWIGDKQLAAGIVPSPDDVIELPPSGVRMLEEQIRSKRRSTPGGEYQRAEIPPVPSGLSASLAAARCKLVVRKALRTMESGGSRHDATCSAVASLARWELAGYPVAEMAIEQLAEAFITAITTGRYARSTLPQAECEWDALLSSARKLAELAAS
jgi:hypothetical protein